MRAGGGGLGAGDGGKQGKDAATGDGPAKKELKSQKWAERFFQKGQDGGRSFGSSPGRGKGDGRS